MKLDMSMDEIIIDTDAISFDALKPTLEAAMSDIRADHKLLSDQSKAPDGRAQKKNSPEYAARKAAGKVRIPGGFRSGAAKNVPTQLTGQMYAGRSIQDGPNEVTMTFAAQDAGKVRGLLEKGYRIHFFSDKNKKHITKLVSAGLETEKLVKVKRGRRRP